MPWTIAGAADFIRRTGAYLTIDTGHASGQRKFQRQKSGTGEAEKSPVKANSDDGYLFASPEDCDIYSWLASLAPYSPVIHLQQTDGGGSPHHPFTESFNRTGIIEPEKILKAVKASYESVNQPLLRPCEEINLTFELFFGLTDTPSEILGALSESVKYWRKSIPKDGLALDELV